ncbi:CAP22 [Colletotrichum higginsianum]|uniref:CAP22 n=1 Tax=Colletotrichum higginsianum (strain IMI 349063) TaxID=759273 RepID=H1W170_COLHI|nr:CAP22 [Colletotrichum higginsianum]
MHAKAVALSLAAAAVVRADLRLNTNDIPQDCTAICRPIRDLGNICTVNFNIGQPGNNNNSDETQDALDAQCVCTNNSFDLKNLAPQCNACMIEKVPQDQQRSLEGIQSIMNVCELPSASGYASSSTSVANTVIVLATRLTASSQLTTTLGGGQQQTPEPTRSPFRPSPPPPSSVVDARPATPPPASPPPATTACSPPSVPSSPALSALESERGG